MIREVYLFLAFFLICLSGFTQQNLFNVPSSDITVKKRLFLQQQINFTKEIWQSNSTLSYGLGGNAEIGVNIVGVNFNSRFRDSIVLVNADLKKTPLNPFVLFNAQKAFQLNDNFKLAVGTQVGINVGGQSHLGNYNYLNLVAEIHKTNTKIIAGLHTINKALVGERKNTLPNAENNFFVGYQIGIEQPLIPHKLFLIADFISGTHTLGETVLGGAYNLTPQWVLSAGYQIPNPQSSSVQAVVVEFSFVPH